MVGDWSEIPRGTVGEVSMWDVVVQPARFQVSISYLGDQLMVRCCTAVLGKYCYVLVSNTPELGICIVISALIRSQLKPINMCFLEALRDIIIVIINELLNLSDTLLWNICL